MQFIVTVTGMDYTRWANDVDVPATLGSNDFADFVTQHITGWLEQTLEEYNVQVAVTEQHESEQPR